MLASGVAMITIAHPGQRRVAGEATAETIDTSGTRPLRPAQHPEGRHVQPGLAADVGVLRPAATPLGKQHNWQPFSGGQIEDTVGLAWLRMPCVPASTV